MQALTANPDTSDEYPSLQDYAAIGDCSVLALVGRNGSIDWLCLPRFSSASIFAAILDRKRGGYFRVGPAPGVAVQRVERRYIRDTAVLQTTWHTSTGVLRLTDQMTVWGPRVKYTNLNPSHEVLRRVECVAGEVAVEVAFHPRPDYARRAARLKERGALGVFCELGDGILVLRSELTARVSADAARAAGREVLAAGQVRHVSLTYDWGEPGALVELGAAGAGRIKQTITWWQQWAAQSRYQGDWPEAVTRSAVVLKLLAFPPSGAVIAAPTTSLPERPGDRFNWDYRYCWLRDASMVVRSLLELGYRGESEAFLSWLLDTTRLTRPRMQVMYGLYGETDLDERTLGWLAGYRGACPVRVGNGAHTQRQIGIYGEVVEAVFHAVQHGGKLRPAHAHMIVGLGDVVCKDWQLPDAGIWESRGEPTHHTHSKLMCWLTLDRLVRLHEAGHLKAPVAHFRQVRADIARAIETRGFNRHLASYTGTFDGDQLDAALYLMVIYGYTGGTGDRLRSTTRLLNARLSQRGMGHPRGPGDQLIYRFRPGYDSCAGDHAPFGLCSFWHVSALARHGQLKQAEAAFDALLSFGSDVGLYGEKIDPTSGDALGNYPQAFTHVGLINAALTIAEERGHIQTRTQPPAGSTGSHRTMRAQPGPVRAGGSR